MPANDTLVVAVANASVRYSKALILDNIDLQVSKGEILAVLGPSGCGKTTLLRVISGAIKGSGVRSVAGKIGIVYQDLKLLPWLTLEQNVLLANSSGDRLSITAQIAEIFDLFGITEKRNSYPYQLSGGQKQRAALARALCAGSDLLLLDEPFSALDFLAKARIAGMIQRVVAELRSTVILVTHDIDDAISLATRIIVMRNGRIVGEFKPADSRSRIETRRDIMALYGP